MHSKASENCPFNLHLKFDLKIQLQNIKIVSVIFETHFPIEWIFFMYK